MAIAPDTRKPEDFAFYGAEAETVWEAVMFLWTSLQLSVNLPKASSKNTCVCLLWSWEWLVISPIPVGKLLK